MGQTVTTDRRKRRRTGSLPLTLLLVSLLAVGGGLIYVAVSAAGKPLTAPIPDAPFAAGTAADPEAEWAPIPTALPPNTLAIPDLKVEANIVTSGLDANGGMILPPPEKVSQFTNGVRFGDLEGTNLIAGHVDNGDRTRGALWPLHQIKPGTPIYVTDNSGTMFTYLATSLSLYEKVALPEEVFTESGYPRLVLVTCGGETVPDASLPSGFTYEQNLVVTAAPQ